MRRSARTSHWLIGISLVATSTSLLAACTKEARPLPEVPSGPAQGGASSAELNAPALEWSYQGARGPQSWAGLRPEWSSCDGDNQSPIDLPLNLLAEPAQGAEASKEPASEAAAESTEEANTSAPQLDGMSFVPQFAALPLEASSQGQLLMLSGASSQGLKVNGSLAPLSAIEVHTPAEHQLGGISADLELALYLNDKELGLISLSLLFRRGAENPAFDALIESLPTQPIFEKELLKGTLPLQDLVPQEQALLAYSGSLTTPPCTENVLHLVMAYVAELSSAQLSQLKSKLPGSSQRPTQALGARQLSLVTLGGSDDAETVSKKSSTSTDKKTP